MRLWKDLKGKLLRIYTVSGGGILSGHKRGGQRRLRTPRGIFRGMIGPVWQSRMSKASRRKGEVSIGG